MKKKYPGSYTVEASLLFPLILGVISLVIYTAFFLHDRAVLDAASYQAALRGSLVTSDKSDFLSKAEKAGDEILSGRLLATRTLVKDIEMKGNTLTVRYTGSLKLPSGILFIPLLPREVTVTAESKAKRLDPTGFVRQCRIIENLKEGTSWK
ncbi:MAG: pilus assembly protein [Lachnospiraceae bacterium]|nr:pilus assembly protein [Lachnospiraceae bacterium]